MQKPLFSVSEYFFIRLMSGIAVAVFGCLCVVFFTAVAVSMPMPFNNNTVTGNDARLEFARVLRTFCAISRINTDRLKPY